MDQFLFRVITCLLIADQAIHIRIDRKSQKPVLRSMRLRIICIRKVIETYSPLVLLNSLRNSRVTEHCSSLQVFLLGIKPRREGLRGTTCIRTGIDIDLAPFPGPEKLSPGSNFACNPDFPGLVSLDASFQKFLNIRIFRVDYRYNGITSHDKSNCSCIHLFLMKFPRQHGIIHHAVKHIGHSLSCTACRHINLNLRIPDLKVIGPLHGKRIESKCA